LLVSAETWGQVYGMGIVDNDYRNGVIAQYAHDLDKAGLATLILVKELAHGKGLKERLEALGSKSRFVNGSTTDDMLDRRVGQFEAGTLNILIATSIFDEGVDIPAIRAIIMGTGGQSKISTLQRIGRGLRHKTGDNRVFIFDFFDDTHRFLRDHATKRLETCRAEDHETILLEKPGKIADLIR
jgi:superfamily II DNA or RNA helicase